MTDLKTIGILLAIGAVFYAPYHYRHYRRHRAAGLTIRESIPGPWRTWFTVSRRFRLRHLILGAVVLLAAVFAAGLALGGHP